MDIAGTDGRNIGVGGAPPVAPESAVAAIGAEPVNPPVNPLGSMGEAVIAAKEAVQIPGIQPAAQEQFNVQFGGITPPAAEAATSTDTGLTDLKTPVAETPVSVAQTPGPVAEIAPVIEETPKEKLLEEIANLVNNYSVEEKTKEEAVV